MKRWRRRSASWPVLLLAPWVVLTLASGGIHNHTGLNLAPAGSSFCDSHRDEITSPPTGTDRALSLTSFTDGRAADDLCPACLWQLTAQADSPADTRAPRIAAITPVADAAGPPPATTDVPATDARAPPRG